MAAGLLVCAWLVVTGCSSSPTAPATTSALTTTSAAPQVRPECAAVTAAARTAGTDLTAYLSGQGNLDQLRTSVQNLSTALGQARTALGADGSRLDAVGNAVQQLVAALQAQPVQVPAVRTAAQQALSSLGDVITICSATSVAPTS